MIFSFFKKKEKAPERPKDEYGVFTTEFDQIKTGRQLIDELGERDKKNWLGEIEIFELISDPIKEKLDISKIAERDRAECFSEAELNKLSVSILMDHSGSLKGLPAMMNCLLVELIADYFAILEIEYEILGYTTSSWKGGSSRTKWLEVGRPARPGRLCDLLHIVYRKASDPISGAPEELRYILHREGLKENIDGEALEWSKNRLSRSDKQNKMILCISDGASVDDTTLLVNDLGYLRKHYQNCIRKISQMPDIKLANIAFRENSPEDFPHALRIDYPNEIAEKLPGFLRQILDASPRNV